MTTGVYIKPEHLGLGLRSNALLILAEIDGLCKRTGECWAQNRHFEDKFGLSNKTVTEALKTLSKLHLIDRKNGKIMATLSNFLAVETTPETVETTPVESTASAVVSTEPHVESTAPPVETTGPSYKEVDKEVKQETKKNACVSASGLFGDEPAPAKKPRQPQPTDPIFDALVKCCGLDPKLNSGMAAKAAHQYLKLGYTAEHVEATARLWTFNNGTMPSVGFITSRIAQGKAACAGKPLAVPVAISGPSNRFGATHKDKKDWL